MSTLGDTDAPMRILVVCTANVCRSPVAERLLTRHLDAAGHRTAVTSAGLIGGRLDVHPFTIDAARVGGIDLTDHRSRLLTRELLAADGADLVICMAREHLTHTVALDPTVWSRTFTLKDLVRRASSAPPAVHQLGWQQWLEQIGTDRQANELLGPDPADDIRDAYSLPAAAHMAMTAELNALCERLAGCIPIR